MQITLTLSPSPSETELAIARAVLDVLSNQSERIVTAPEIAARLAADTLPAPSRQDDPDAVFQRIVPPPNGDSYLAGRAAELTHDAKGLPWDERIHSGNRATNQDGSWKKRRGVSDETVTLVEAQLHGQPAAAVAPNPPAPPAPPVPPSPPPPVSGDAPTFVSLMKRFSEGVDAKYWPPTTAADMARSVGLANVLELDGRSDTWPRVSRYLDARQTGVDHDTAVAMVG